MHFKVAYFLPCFKFKSYILGDPDENVFIVQKGKINVFVTNLEGISISLKIVKTGDSLTSLLSFADVLTVCLILLNLF